MLRNVLLVGLLSLGISTGTDAKEVRATIIDRDGNRFEVRDLKLEGQKVLFLVRGDERSKLRFREIRKIKFIGGRSEEEMPVRVKLRDGRLLEGTVYVGGLVGYVRGARPVSFTGHTDLGKFTIPLRDVREVFFYGGVLLRRCPKCGRMFEQKDYKFCPYDGTKLELVEVDTTKMDTVEARPDTLRR